MLELLNILPQIFKLIVALMGVLAISAVVNATPVGATGIRNQCNTIVIAKYLNQTGPADARGDLRKLAEINTDLSAEMAQCYISGKSGGRYFGQSPLWDLLQAAGGLSSASVSWGLAGEHHRQCAAIHSAIGLYEKLRNDRSISTPPSDNYEIRQLGAAGLKNALHLASQCSQLKRHFNSLLVVGALTRVLCVAM